MAPYFLKPLMSMIGKVNASEGGWGRGWGEAIAWVNLEEGQKRAASDRKPLMVIVHRNTCPVCQTLKEAFSSSNQIYNLSRMFTMVNLDSENDLIPSGSDFAPDGHYVPRIMFFAPDGRLLKDACNLRRRNFKFNYDSDLEIVDMMNTVIGWGKSGFL